MVWGPLVARDPKQFSTYPFGKPGTEGCSTSECWTADGKYQVDGHFHENDLVEEVPDAPAEEDSSDALQLRVGGTYKARNGGVVMIVEDDGTSHMPCLSDKEYWYHRNGRLSDLVEDEDDLIEEIIPNPVSPTPVPVPEYRYFQGDYTRIIWRIAAGGSIDKMEDGGWSPVDYDSSFALRPDGSIIDGYTEIDCPDLGGSDMDIDVPVASHLDVFDKILNAAIEFTCRGCVPERVYLGETERLALSDPDRVGHLTVIPVDLESHISLS